MSLCVVSHLLFAMRHCVQFYCYWYWVLLCWMSSWCVLYIRLLNKYHFVVWCIVYCYADCCYAVCHYAVHMLRVAFLIVILSVILSSGVFCVVMLSVVMLYVRMMSVVFFKLPYWVSFYRVVYFYSYAQCHDILYYYPKCHSAKCRCIECCSAKNIPTVALAVRKIPHNRTFL